VRRQSMLTPLRSHRSSTSICHATSLQKDSILAVAPALLQHRAVPGSSQPFTVAKANRVPTPVVAINATNYG